MLFPERFLLPSCYSSALAAFGPLLKLERRGWQWIVEDVGCNVVIDWCTLTECRMPWDIFNCSNPGCVERSWRRCTIILVQTWNFVKVGAPIPFSLTILFYLFEPRQFNCDLLPRCFRPFWLSAFHWPCHWGLILKAHFPGRFLIELFIYMATISLASDMIRMFS